MDTNVLAGDVHTINVLTVVANESYDKFARGLQDEMAEAVADRPRAVNAALFEGMVITDKSGNEQVVDPALAGKIQFSLIKRDYVDEKGALTDKYYEDVKAGAFVLADEIKCIFRVCCREYSTMSIIREAFRPEDARSRNVTLQVVDEKLQSKEFKALWEKINSRTAYVVDFDSRQLIRKSIESLDEHLKVQKIFYKVETGEQKTTITDKDTIVRGESFEKKERDDIRAEAKANAGVKIRSDWKNCRIHQPHPEGCCRDPQRDTKEFL